MATPIPRRSRRQRLRRQIQDRTTHRYLVNPAENTEAINFATLRRARLCHHVMGSDQPILRPGRPGGGWLVIVEWPAKAAA